MPVKDPSFSLLLSGLSQDEAGPAAIITIVCRVAKREELSTGPLAILG